MAEVLGSSGLKLQYSRYLRVEGDPLDSPSIERGGGGWLFVDWANNTPPPPPHSGGDGAGREQQREQQGRGVCCSKN